MIDLPPVLDFEASSLSDISYPITAGLVVNGRAYYWVIKPQSDWVDWSLASQAIHGIKRSYLIEHGMAALQVYEEMKAVLGTTQALYSDNPYWEKRWLSCLGVFAIEVRDIRELLPELSQPYWAECLATQFKVHELTRHRADHDAYAMYMAVNALNGQMQFSKN